MDKTFETEEIGQCRTKITFSIPYEEVKTAIDRAFDEVKGSAVVPGFRPGKAPRPMVERKYGKLIKEETLNKLLPESYYEAIKEHGLLPLSEPAFEEINYEKDKPLTFTATVEVYPKFELPDYKNIEIKKAEIKEVTDEDIQKIIDAQREYNAKYEPLEDIAAGEGHFVLVNIDQEMDGEKNTKQNQMLEINKEKIFPEFVENLIGKKPGDKCEFDINFPEDYQSSEVAGKTVHFAVELLEVKEKVLPELDDDFARDTGRAETFDGLKEDIRKTLSENNEEAAKTEEENEIVDKIVNAVDFEIPATMMKKQMQSNIQRVLEYAMRSHTPRSEMEEKKDAIYKKAEEDSRRQIKLFLLLDKIAEEEGITIEDSDVEDHIKRIAELRRMDAGELRKKMEEGDEIDMVKNRLTHEKVMELLYDNAKKN